MDLAHTACRNNFVVTLNYKSSQDIRAKFKRLTTMCIMKTPYRFIS